MAHASLQFAGLFLSFFLKIAVAYLVCWGLTRLLDNPRDRFRLWLAFLVGSGIYWAILVFSSLPGFSTAGSGRPTAADASFAPHFFIPLAWYSAVSWAGTILFWTYCSGFAFLVSTTVWKHCRLRMLLRSGAEPTPELERLFALLARECGVRGCRLVILPALNSPATVYWLHPRILLPESCACLQDEDVAQLADVLHHELEHIARRDYLWASVSDLLCGALFFHPAAWQARKHLRLQRELACDQAVVAARPEHRADYATTLAQFVRRHMLERRASPGVDLASSASFLGMRIRAILSEPRNTPWWQKVSWVTASAGLIALFGVFCPALAVFVEFAPQLLPAATSPAQSQSEASRARRKPVAVLRRAQQSGTAQPMAESLTSLRTQYVPETPVFQLSRTADHSPEPVPLLGPETPRSSTVTYPFPKPSVAGVLRAASEIAVIVRGGHGPPRSGGNKPDSDDMH